MTYFKTAKDTEKVIRYAKIGIPQEDIASALRIGHETLRKYFGDEIDEARMEADASIGETLYQKAMSGDTTAMIWWTKARMRWKETRQEERRVVDKDGNDIHLKDLELLNKLNIEA